MQIERKDGTTEKREYKDIKAMMRDAKKEAKSPNTAKLTLVFPKNTFPKKRRKK